MNRRKKFSLTDLGNAKRLDYRHGDHLRYCHSEKCWYRYSGKCWTADIDGQVMRDAVETVQSMEKDHPDHARKSKSAQRLREMINLAQDLEGVPVRPEDFDRNPYLLNVHNGTIELNSQKLLRHDPGLLLRQIAPVKFDPNALCPEWNQFLHDITNGDKELMDFLQRYIGYCISGDTREQKFGIFFGDGANGKSTCINTILRILGAYAQQAPSNTFTTKRSASNTNDLARMEGKRLVLVPETERNAALSEELIKQITGGEQVVSRYMYREFFEFAPQCKLVMVTNHRPVIKGCDEGIWRRVLLVPFTVTIPTEKQDLELGNKLMDEASGILNWMLEGYRKWRQEGLNPPKIVTEYTREYRSEMNWIGRFIDDCCVVTANASVKSSDLYKAYKKWTEYEEEFAVSHTEFSKRLQSAGYRKKRKSTGWFWIGLGLNEV